MAPEELGNANSQMVTVKPNRRECFKKFITSMRQSGCATKFKFPMGRCCKLLGACPSPVCQHDYLALYRERVKLRQLAWPKAALGDPNIPRKKTLVVDLDETLVHSSLDKIEGHNITLTLESEPRKKQIHVNLRPFSREFIAAATRMFEVVIFTAATSDYANPVIDLLDCERRIHARLFREHCTIWNGCFIKDLELFDRDSKDIVIIDNTPSSYFLQPHNAIPISSWYGSRSDRELVLLLPFLRKLSLSDDVVPLLNERYGPNGDDSGIICRIPNCQHTVPTNN
ncbi:Dullard-like phosphatase domain containing protein [Babesia ovis]|uniref:Dullard-like phosphatase domain containing protein n=1 Tax=Babesia ovis TaxID=5869 RepID=A0A9W5WTP4_BABOV|nr:Dullard-like phosphatase domain containing protein [Babesia ovis]